MRSCSSASSVVGDNGSPCRRRCLGSQYRSILSSTGAGVRQITRGDRRRTAPAVGAACAGPRSPGRRARRARVGGAADAQQGRQRREVARTRNTPGPVRSPRRSRRAGNCAAAAARRNSRCPSWPTTRSSATAAGPSGSTRTRRGPVPPAALASTPSSTRSESRSARTAFGMLEVGAEVAETSHAVEGVANYQQRPPLADDLEGSARSGNSRRCIREVGPPGDLILEGSLTEPYARDGGVRSMNQRKWTDELSS